MKNTDKDQVLNADGFTYKGYTYVPWDDFDGDCTKIWHDFIHEDGREVHLDWSPYSIPSDEDVKLWIDLGMPERIGCCPLNHNDLIEIKQYYLLHSVA